MLGRITQNPLQAGAIVALLLMPFAEVCSQSFPAGRSTEFARVSHLDDGRPRALEIAITTYVAEDRPDVSVDLVGAVHVGDSAYYAELNDRFEEYDALLFEMIAPEGIQDRIGETERKGFISSTQMALTRALGLSFQLDEIAYDRPNFVHADLTPEELSESMHERGESLYVYFWRLFYASVNEAAKDPLGLRAWRDLSTIIGTDQESPLKIAFAYEMTNIDVLSGVLDGEAGSAIIDSRNQRAIDVLKAQIARGARRIGIFYGVAHMPDFERRLVDQLDMAYESTVWVDAWMLDTGHLPQP